MSKSSLKLDVSHKKSKEKGDIHAHEEKTSPHSEHIEYMLGRIYRRLEKSLSRRRKLPYVEDNGENYDSYIFNFVNFIEERGHLIEDLYSREYERVLKAVKTFRAILSDSNRPPINEVIDLGLLPKFVECLKSQERMLQYEAAWLITNISYCSSVQTRFIIESGAVDALIRLMWTDCDTVQTQAAWALGNIAGDEPEFRDHIVSKGAIPGVVHVIKTIDSEKMLMTCAWALENLCSGSKDYGRIIQVLPIIREFLLHTNSELVCKFLRVLTHLTVEKKLIKETMYCHGLLSNIVDLLHGEDYIVCCALQVLANLANTDDFYVTENLLDPNILGKISIIFQSGDVHIRRIISLFVQNLTSSNETHIERIITSDIFQLLLERFNEEDDEKVKKHTITALWNVLSLGSSELINELINFGLLNRVCLVLSDRNECIVHSALCCLEKVLRFGEEKSDIGELNHFAVEMEDIGGLQDLEYLLSHESENVYLKAHELMEKYFNFQEESKPENLDDFYSEFIPKEYIDCCS